MDKLNLSFWVLLSVLLLGCNNANKRGCEDLNSQENRATMESVIATDSFVEAVNQSELYERKKTELRNQMISCCSNKLEKNRSIKSGWRMKKWRYR